MTDELVLDEIPVIVAGEPLELTDTVWDATDPPVVAVKLTGFGEATRPDVPPPAPTVKFTWKFTCPTVVVTETVPA